MKKVFALVLSMMLAVSAMTACSSGNDTAENIHVVSREDGSGTRGAFIELMGIEVKGENGTRTDMTTVEASIASKTDVMLTTIAGDQNAIGYVSLGSLNDSVKAVKIDGVEASAENIKNGTYAVARPFNIAYQGELQGVAKDFVAFILSAEGQAIVADGYIAVNDTAEHFESDLSAGKIVVAGSSSVSPVMEKLQEAYLAINDNAEIEIQTTDSSAGMTAVMDGTCDIGMASRDLKESEAAVLTSLAIAQDGIAVIVNTENPLDDLTKEQVKDIFTGSVTAWSAIG